MTPEQCRAARALLGWSQDELRTQAAVHKRTVAGLERGEAHERRDATLDKIRKALESAGVEFIEDGTDGRGAGVRFKRSSRRAKR
jgi:transcriptional regulator with XRE-family HTH domain